AAHRPGEPVADGVAVDLGRMEVEENIGENAQRAAAVRVIVLDPEHGFEKLRLFRALEVRDLFSDLNFKDLRLFLELLDKDTQAFGLPAVTLFLFGHRNSLVRRARPPGRRAVGASVS